ncbi:putative arabinose efflux permease, MFS family [Streptoalloteichus tenebrarius]|uniref:Arabinose efflux permease, MFS family n=1 Tax=Streptoalloteichus tenebrarius (strain ATCC 17920 / DSM 40477 / JCM 4838 / CBS 697.72 / NBRC 16177 / NCIMB 11028 / NRRL B-12390 / A12253. 1 / ISP 5477) TaxID=1933 RepID=A0ABT1HNN4_STRSD|nr:MFS transporter [Streptoalloteichus tenebrarius]MCP2257121.1 putative arabinose efflux permease, MFS family [Streptoalloteichus tenebrarius]BFE98753.1 MFS transporter [Streptoalloteichus tenebrarius]
MPPTSRFLSRTLTPPFRGFFLGRLVSLLGSAMNPVALALAVLDASGRPRDLGVVLAAQIVPHLALLLVGGAVADRYSRRAVLVAANLGAGITQGAVAAVLITGRYDLPLVAGLGLANGALDAFASPALRGIVPELVAPDDLQRANALLASARNATKILGPTVAALLVVGVGGGWAIAVDALSYLAAAGLLARLPASTVAVRRGHLFADIRDGWREFLGIPWVWIVTLSCGLINLVHLGAWQVLGPQLTSERGGEALWGVVLSVRAIGLLVTSVVMCRVTLRHPLRAGLATGAVGGLALVALGLHADVPVLLASALVSGMGFTALGIAWDTALQQHVPRDALSRVSSYSDLLSYVTMPVSQLLIGPVAARWGGAPVAFWCGIAFAVVALTPLAARSVRNLPAAAPT